VVEDMLFWQGWASCEEEKMGENHVGEHFHPRRFVNGINI
jgi:hypothetical protein